MPVTVCRLSAIFQCVKLSFNLFQCLCDISICETFVQISISLFNSVFLCSIIAHWYQKQAVMGEISLPVSVRTGSDGETSQPVYYQNRSDTFTAGLDLEPAVI